MNAISRKTTHRSRRTSPLKVIFTAMAMMLVIGGAVSPVMPILEAAIAAAPIGDEPLPIEQPPVEVPPVEIDPPVNVDPPRDSDQDGIPDDQDSCPKLPNTGLDWDGDGTDDACDPPPEVGEPPLDSDQDGIPDSQDSCPNLPNLGTDWDGDGVDDACDPQPADTDGDGIPDDQDSCPNLPNLGTDWDGDGIDDACDPQPVDTDGDGIPDDQDSCPNTANHGADWDGDGIDDACDPQPADTDGDGIPDDQDSCPNTANLGADWDGDGIDDACDPQPQTAEPPADSDNDGIPDETDSCVDLPNFGSDYNNDGMDDACDPPPADTDSDGVPDSEDTCVDIVNIGIDSDGDGTDDACDPPEDPGDETFNTLAEPAESDYEEYLYVVLNWCPSGIDLSTYPADSEGPTGDCSESGHESTVVVTSATDSSSTFQQLVAVPTGSSGMSTEFRPIPVDTWKLHVETDIALTDESLHCAGYHSSGNTRPYGSATFAIEAGNTWETFDVETVQDEYTYCNWYGVLADTGDLTIVKRLCVTTPEPDADWDWFFYNCASSSEDLQGFEFTMTHSDGTVTPGTTDSIGEIHLNALETGSYILEETVSSGHTPLALFCIEAEPGATLPAFLPLEVVLSGNSAELTINSDLLTTCFWFNSGGIYGNGPGALYITKYECTITPPASASIEWYQDNCPATMDGVTFTLDLPEPLEDRTAVTVSADYPGTAGMTNVNPGVHTLTETPPEGYTPHALFCGPVVPFADPAYLSMPLTGNSAEVTIVSNWVVACEMYNVATDEEDDPGELRLTKFICTTQPESDEPYSWYRDNCTETMANVEFTFDRPDPETDDVLSTGDGLREAHGVLRLYRIDPGTYPLIETEQPGYTPIALFCAPGDADSPTPDLGRTPVTLSGHSAELTFTAGLGLDCYWYNYGPSIADTGDFILNKRECLTTPEPGASFSWYSANCTMPMEGVQFTLGQPDPELPVTGVTDASGEIRMPGVIPGTHSLHETVPDGYMPQALFCRLLNRGTSVLETPDAVAITENAATVTIDANKRLECFWFNIHIDADNGPGDLKLMKYECTSTPPAAAAYEWYRDNCTTTMDGVNFTLDKPDPEPDLSTATNDTGTSGYIQMLGLDPGTYPLTETPPAGYTPQALFCGTVAIDTVPTDAEYAPVTLAGNTADVTISSNQLLYCKMFNLKDDPGISLTIHKFNCPPEATVGGAGTTDTSLCLTEPTDVQFEITDDSGTQNATSAVGGVVIPNLKGEITIQEIIPPGFGEPIVVCELGGFGVGGPEGLVSTNGLVTLSASTEWDYECWFYNIPEPESTVIINKFRCPEGAPAEMTAEWFAANCTDPMDDVAFDLTDSKGPRQKTTSGGKVEFTDVATGAVQIKENIPDGFAQQPFLVCVTTDSEGVSSAPFTPETVNGTWNTSIAAGGSIIECDWFNWYLGDGEITVHKLTCPAGYDRSAWGADPMTDCKDATDGITFELNQPDPEVDLQSATGDSIPGAVYFGGLQPGEYTITEMVDLGTYQDIFVWQCVGLSTSSVHPTPLSVGRHLTFTIAAGDSIECHWFNVPYPELGWMEVHKFNCTTETYFKDVYCYTNQTGQEFNLQLWDGSTWTTIQSGITDVSGELTFHDLDAGDYRLVEPDGEACLMKSSNITENDNLGVTIGEGTTVYVYNCKTPPPPQKTPTKYPNTGVGSAGEGETSWTPGLGLAGVIGLLGTQLTRRRMVASAGLAAASTLPLAVAQQIVPLDDDATPVPGTPEPGVFWCATPSTPALDEEATPSIDPCNRGAIPIQMRIPVIEVDAPIEYLEIIDGQMQQPTGDTHITWYKETSRLGEVGNGIYAAHVNWYGNPEGIFFRLESLQEGDVIEIDGDDQQTLLYEVQWMQNFPSDEEPPEEALGITNDIVITLITCGGEWSSALSEYDHRTLVRAVLRE